MASELLHENSKVSEYNQHQQQYQQQQRKTRIYKSNSQTQLQQNIAKQSLLPKIFESCAAEKEFTVFETQESEPHPKNGVSKYERCVQQAKRTSSGDNSNNGYDHDKCSVDNDRTTIESYMGYDSEKTRNGGHITKVNNKSTCLSANTTELLGDYKDFSEIIFYCSKCQNHPIDEYITGNLKQCKQCILRTNETERSFSRTQENSLKKSVIDEDSYNVSLKCKTKGGKCRGKSKSADDYINNKKCCQSNFLNKIDVNVHTVDTKSFFCCPHKCYIQFSYENINVESCHCQTICSKSKTSSVPVTSSSKVQTSPKRIPLLQTFPQSQESSSLCSRRRDHKHKTHVCCELQCYTTTSERCSQNVYVQPLRQYDLRNRIASKFIDWNNMLKTNTQFAVNDIQKFIRTILPIVILFNMLPLLYAECDQTFVSRAGGPQNGTFSAPMLHNPANHSKQCLYIFLAGPGQRVDIVFTTFNLRGAPPDGSAVGELPACVHEYMDIYAEVQSSDPGDLINSPFGGRYCGPIPPRRRISMYRAVALSFFTNKNFTTPELFEGRYSFINASEYEIGIPLAGSPCSYTVTPTTSINKTGALVSPTYPGAYPKDMSCTYQFLGESNQRVRLEFRDFDLFFGGPHCPFDYVKVYDGPDNSSALIGTYCGQQRNLVLYSSESSLFVHFFTLPRTANTQNRGFKGIYEFSESFVKLDFIRQNDGIHIRGSECDQKILSKKESSGYVFSPNYPYPYIQKTVCRYFVYGMQDAQHLERVRLEFSIFEIPRVESKDKGETNCSDGYLKVYLRGQETADAYDKFDYELCGNESESVVSDGPRLAMVFSAGELQGRGFKARYIFETEYKIPGTAAPDGTCSFTYRSASKKKGELNSPRYPSNYPSDTNCSYMFHAAPNEQVTIVFDHFKVKADNVNTTGGAYGASACFEDWLEMYIIYRDGPDRFLGRYCGLTAPGPVESPKGAVGLRIQLHTDQENVASGFKARYVFEAAKSEFGDCGGNFSGQYSGIITSPNYPADYKGPSRGFSSNACNWYITARLGYKISVNFEFFSVEGDPPNRGCPAAVLRLWTNLDSDSPPVELCGEKNSLEPWHYVSQGQSARISFTTSDKTIGAQGFRIVWTEIQDSGPGPPSSSINLLCESSYHFLCNSGFCIADKLRCDGVKNCGPDDDSDEMHCTLEAPKEDHGVLIISSIIAGSFLICLLCTLCHRKRKRRHHRQLGLHRNAAHYDSTTSATGLSSSRRHLQGAGAGSLSGSLHGIDPGSLSIPPAPSPPTSIPPPPHICITAGGAGILSGADDDDDDDEDNPDLFVNDVRFEDDDNNDESV